MLLAGGFMAVRLAPAQPPDAARIGTRVASAFIGPLAVQLIEQTDSSAGGTTYVSLYLSTCDDQACYDGIVGLAPDQYAISRGGASVTGPIDITLQLFTFCDEPPLSMEVTVGDLTWKTFGQTFPGHQGSQFHNLFGDRSFYSLRTSEREANATGLISGGIEIDLADADFASVGKQDYRYANR